MAKIEIDDDLLAALAADVKKRLLSDDPTAFVNDLIRGHLRTVCAPGHERDGLTGCLTRQQLGFDINRASWGTSWTDHSVYKERFLCIDINCFKSFVDHEGFERSDKVLVTLGEALRGHFGESSVYRHGGDEFVVVLGDRPASMPTPTEQITLKHSVVNVAVHRNPQLNRHINGWIEHHIQAGILASSQFGTVIECGDPVWLQVGQR